MPARRLLLLGWAGADWRLVQPLLDAGRMPHLSQLIDRGCAGRLVSVAPPHPAAQWASVLTGQAPDLHGVLAWTLPDADALLGVRLLDSGDWQAPPLWERARAHGLAACAVGFPATHPARQLGGGGPGVVVSDGWALASGRGFDDWSPLVQAVSPALLADALAELRVHPSDIGLGQVLGLVPEAARIDQETDPRLTELVTWLAQAATVHSTATHLMATQPWQLMAVHFDLLERLSSRFLDCRPPRMAHVTATDEAIYGPVVDNAYQFMDLVLGRYLALLDEVAGPPATVLLVSDHGFHGGQRRPGNPVDGRQPAAGFRPQGLLVAAGPEVVRDRLVFGADLLDIAPTALHLLGLPVPADLPGRVLQQLLATGTTGDNRTAAAEPQPPAPGAPHDPTWARQRLRELVGIGLLQPPPGDPEAVAHAAECLLLDHRVQSCMAHGRPADALPWLDRLATLSPDRPDTLLARGRCLLALGDVAGCHAAVAALQEAGHAGPALDAFRAQLCLHAQQPAQALALLLQAEADSPPGHRLADPLGQVHLLLGQWAEAQHRFQQVLQEDPDDARALVGLGQALAAGGDPEAALPWLMRSLSLQHIQPHTHHLLGRCLALLGRFDEAQAALQRALAQQPGLDAARQALRDVQRRSVAQAIAAGSQRA